MSPERWRRLTELFDEALERAPSDRSSFLSSACPDDEALRREVEQLLESHDRAGGFGDTAAFRFTPATQLALNAGSRLGRYEVIALVGRGGMGEVYRARDPQLAREVAIKVLRQRGDSHSPGLSPLTTEQLERFAREARAAGALHHPNILAVYDIGVAEGTPYVVSELLQGETLRERLARGPLPHAEAIAVATQVLAGLGAAHDKGIVHRDLKPANLFIATDGGVKILDFGLAKGDEEDADRGLIMGTAGYMAPEQVRGEEADARADIFSFGTVFYEMLTGRRAFGGESAVDTMQAVLSTEPPLAALDDEVRDILRRCLAKDPQTRFAAARDVMAALSSLAPSQPPVTDRRASFVYAAAAALLLAAVMSAVFALPGQPAPPRPGAAGRPALAVLPFEDRSDTRGPTWYASGIASMLVTSLAQTPGLDVIGNERLDASLHELGDGASRLAVARHAGAGAALVGTVFTVGNEMRIDVQVQDVESGRVVVARSEQGPDLFTLVDAVARHVRTALDVSNRTPSRPLRDVTTTSIEAYALYAKGQAARHNNRLGDARTLFYEALRIDPGFTLARAQLVTMLERLGERTAAAAERRVIAGQLDRLPERQRLLTEAVERYDADPVRAIDLLQRLIARYPDEEEAYDAIVHAYTHTRDPAYYGKTLAFMQRWAQAIPGPGSGHFHNHYGYAYIEHGLFTEAEREFRAYIRVSPDEANGYDSLAELFLITGRPQLAIDTYDRALTLNPSFGWSHFGRAYALAMKDRYDEAFAELSTLKALGDRAGVPRTATDILSALLSSRVGTPADVAGYIAAARNAAHAFGDASAAADADLVEATTSLDRGDHRRAIELAGRAVEAGTRTQVDIMRARRIALAHLIAGIAEARRGAYDAARVRLAVLRTIDGNGDPIQLSWHRALEGEIALGEGRLDAAEAAFEAAEYQIGSSFAIYPALVALANNLPFRDGLARTALARGDRARARALYVRLNQPDASSKWCALFDRRYARAAARLGQDTSEVPVFPASLSRDR